MVYILFGLIVVSIILGAITKEKSQYFFIWCWLIMTLFMGGTLGYKGDYYVYSEQFYGRYRIQPLEFMYTLFITIGRNIGLDYDTYSLLFIGLALGIFMYTIYKFCGYAYQYLILYLIFPMFLNIIQLRHFMATSIVFLAYYVSTLDIKRKKLAVLAIGIIAVGFQLSSIFFLPLLFLYDFKKSKTLYFILSGMLLVSIILSAFPDAVSMLFLTSNITSLDYRIAGYVSGQVRIGFLFNWAMLAANCIISRLSLKVYTESCTIDEKKHEILYAISNMAIIMIVYSPLFRLSSVFARIIEMFAPFMYLSFLIRTENIYNQFGTIRTTKKQLQLTIISIVYFAIVVWIKIIWPHWEDVVMITFQSRKWWF